MAGWDEPERGVAGESGVPPNARRDAVVIAATLIVAGVIVLGKILRWF